MVVGSKSGLLYFPAGRQRMPKGVGFGPGTEAASFASACETGCSWRNSNNEDLNRWLTSPRHIQQCSRQLLWHVDHDVMIAREPETFLPAL
jgi:hypothetical protein